MREDPPVAAYVPVATAAWSWDNGKNEQQKQSMNLRASPAAPLAASRAFHRIERGYYLRSSIKREKGVRSMQNLGLGIPHLHLQTLDMLTATAKVEAAEASAEVARIDRGAKPPGHGVPWWRY